MAGPIIKTKSENDMLGQRGRIDKSIGPEPPTFELANLSALRGPRFVVTLDTEEEFDWSKPFSRDGFGTRHLKSVPRFQELCDAFGIQPCYLVDLPVAEDSYGADLLSGYAQDGRAGIGMQLHPWVNPPFEEELNARNSFACNLSPALERAKITYLHNAVVQRLGVKPDAYRAGRYGAGPTTADILHDLGIMIDSSVRARFDYSDQHGPDFSEHPIHPYWLRKGQLLELPLTTVFAGALRGVGDKMFRGWCGSHASRSMLSRSNLLKRIALTPEGIPLEKALHGIDYALLDQVPILNISLHSPSLAVGHTPYVRDVAQLEQLYAWLNGVFQHLRDNNVRPVNMAEIKSASRITCFR